MKQVLNQTPSCWTLTLCPFRFPVTAPMNLLRLAPLLPCLAVIGGLSLTIAREAYAQPPSAGAGLPPAIQSDDPYDELAGEFAFVRLQYDSLYQGRWGYGSWSTDFPAADNNFLRGVSRLSNIRVMPDPVVLSLRDEEIFEYPILYALRRRLKICGNTC